MRGDQRILGTVGQETQTDLPWCVRNSSVHPHCPSRREVAGSISSDVTGLFIRPNSSSRSVALGSAQPLTGMCSRKLPWWSKDRPARKAENLDVSEAQVPARPVAASLVTKLTLFAADQQLPECPQLDTGRHGNCGRQQLCALVLSLPLSGTPHGPMQQTRGPRQQRYRAWSLDRLTLKPQWLLYVPLFCNGKSVHPDHTQ
jgi:hypothetical protein